MALPDTERLDEIALDAGYDARSYSGRGMYGKSCLAITTDDSLLATLANLIEECNHPKEAADLVRGASTDDMGRGLVIYWKNVPPMPIEEEPPA